MWIKTSERPGGGTEGAFRCPDQGGALSLEVPASLWARRVLLQLTFQGTSFHLSDARTRERHSERGQNQPHSFQRLALSQDGPFHFPNFPSSLAQSKSSSAGGPGTLRPVRPCWVHSSNFFSGGRAAQPGNTQLPTAQSLAGKGTQAAAVGGAKSRSQHRVLRVWPALRPLNRRLCSCPARGRRHNGPAPTPALCAKAPRRPVPYAPAGLQLSSPGCSRLNCLLYVLLTFI